MSEIWSEAMRRTREAAAPVPVLPAVGMAALVPQEEMGNFSEKENPQLPWQKGQQVFLAQNLSVDF